tara:strand:+ start:1689 stop:2279 length:591 start_codon:yes stop_codon:yes gene_type:complete
MNPIFLKGVDYTKNFLIGYQPSDIFISSSLNHESVLALSILEEAGFLVDVYCVDTGLIEGDLYSNYNLVKNRFNHNITIIDAKEKKNELLKGKDFLSLDEAERSSICKVLKRDTLFDHIKNKNYKIWISAIRKVETKSRMNMKAISISNGLIKFSPIFNFSNIEVYYIMRSYSLGFLEEVTDKCKINDMNECGLHL